LIDLSRFESEVCVDFLKGFGSNGEIDLKVKFVKVPERFDLCD